jgi:hypothetical protein
LNLKLKAMENIILSPIDTDILIHRIAERTVELLKREKPHPHTQPDNSGELFTRLETLSYLRITGATLWRWEKQNKIKSYGISGKRYFKKSEIDASLIQKK